MLEAELIIFDSRHTSPVLRGRLGDARHCRGEHHDRHVWSDFRTMLLWRDVSTSVTRSWLPPAVFDDAEHGLRTSTGNGRQGMEHHVTVGERREWWSSEWQLWTTAVRVQERLSKIRARLT